MRGAESAPAPLVAVVMGSDSDLPTMERCLAQLEALQIGHDVFILSAHRSPEAAVELARNAVDRGYGCIVAAAGGAAHLAGVLAAHTILPVIGVPMASRALSGVDSLYSTVQMPAGIPVATVAIGEAGARNAAILAAQILAGAFPALQTRLLALKEELREQTRQKNEKAHRSRRFP